MSNKRSKKNEAKGLNDTFILKVKFKGNDTWRIVGTNRRKEKLVKQLEDLAPSVAAFRMDVMDGKTSSISVYDIGYISPAL